MNEDIARRSIDSVKWNFISNILYNLIYFAQTIILARLLPVESFGIYAGAASIVVMTNSFATFGLGGAFLHRCMETEDIEQTAAIHFTLQFILNIAWTVLMLAGGLLFLNKAEPGMLTVYVVLTLTYTLRNFTTTPRIILSRQIKFQRIAVLTALDAVITFISAVLLALLDQPIWALLATNISNAILHIVVFYIWKPVWKPSFRWDMPVVKYFLRFGSRQVLSGALLDVLDRGDDFWTKTYLGAGPLGYYSRAYAIAKIPGNIIASPMSSVAVSTYAELKNDKKGLTEAFFETNALLIRTGFLLVGVLALVAPEFIRIVLGEKWMPMLMTFRLMLPFTMFDPLKQMMAHLFVAVGKPEVIVKIRLIQVIILVVSLFALGLPFGIEGVAIAVDIMMVAGIAMILYKAKDHVELFVGKMFLVPGIGLLAGLLAGYAGAQIQRVTMNDWVSGAVKAGLFVLVYGLVTILLEKDQIRYMVTLIKKYVIKKT
ncbi:MAG: oligosaccharide flippase family protein [Chloroflexi bacterium]|nr:oligosaccharide flippase family protein [Chloroflexota bacterium]